jgi:hypothetical protein
MIRLAVLLLLPVALLANGEKERVNPPKTLEIKLSRYNQVFMGRDTLTVADLPKEIKSRLWKSYLGTGKMHDRIVMEVEAGVTKEMETALEGAIRQGLQMALKDICLEKHKQYFEDLTERQREKLKKQFPVLFQKNFAVSSVV